MTEPSYLSKLHEWCSHPTSQRHELLLLRLLEELNLPELEDLLADILLDHPSCYEIFFLPKGEQILPYSVSYLNRLGLSARQSISRALERLLGRGISSGEDRLTRGALFVAASILEEPLLSYLLNLLAQEGLRDEIRKSVASALSSHPHVVPPQFWMDVDVVRYPSLAPMCISALAATSPEAALQVLIKLPLSAADMPFLEYPLRSTLRSLFVKQTAVRELTQLWAIGSEEVKTLLRTVSEFSEFDLFRAEIHSIIRKVPVMREPQYASLATVLAMPGPRRKQVLSEWYGMSLRDEFLRERFEAELRDCEASVLPMPHGLVLLDKGGRETPILLSKEHANQYAFRQFTDALKLGPALAKLAAGAPN